MMGVRYDDSNIRPRPLGRVVLEKAHPRERERDLRARHSVPHHTKYSLVYGFRAVGGASAAYSRLVLLLPAQFRGASCCFSLPLIQSSRHRPGSQTVYVQRPKLT